MRWGNPEPRELVERFSIVRMLQDQRDFLSDVQLGSLRVYALPTLTAPFGLHYESSGGAGKPPESVSFEYKNDDGSVTLTLNTADWLYGRDIVSRSDLVSGGRSPSFYDRLRGDLAASSDLEMSPRTLTLDGHQFEGGVFESPERPAELNFVFRAPEVTLHGSATGLTQDDLIGILAQLVAVNDHPALVTDLQAEADARRKRLNPPQPPIFTIADRPSSAFARLQAVQSALATRYPNGVLTGFFAAADQLTANGTAQLWSIRTWDALPPADVAAMEALLRPAVPDRPGTVHSSHVVFGVTNFADKTDPAWDGALAVVEQSSGKSPPSLAPLVQYGALGLLDSIDAVIEADMAAGAAFRQSSGGSLTRMALGVQPDNASLLVLESASTRPVWGLRYDSADRSSTLFVILDAQTGAILYSGS
jgi:hypothetical protein